MNADSKTTENHRGHGGRRGFFSFLLSVLCVSAVFSSSALIRVDPRRMKFKELGQHLARRSEEDLIEESAIAGLFRADVAGPNIVPARPRITHETCSGFDHAGRA